MLSFLNPQGNTEHPSRRFLRTTATVATLLVTTSGLLVWALLADPQVVPRGVPVAVGSLALVSMFTARFLIRSLRRRPCASRENEQFGTLFGADDAGRLQSRGMGDRRIRFFPAELLDDDKARQHSRIDGVRLRGTGKDIDDVAQRSDATAPIEAPPLADAGLAPFVERRRHPRIGRMSAMMGLLASGFVIANVARPSAAVADTPPTYVPTWAPSTAYAFGQQVISPSNDVVAANVAHTSSAAYVIDTAKWTLSSTYALDRFNGAAVGESVAARMAGKRLVVLMRHDDLQVSAYDYLPVYAQYGMHASFYCVLNYLDTTGFSTTTQLRAIHAAGHEIGSHSMTHSGFTTGYTAGTPLTEAQRRYELEASQRSIEDLIGEPGYVCETFMFPFNQIVATETLDYYLQSGSEGLVGYALDATQTLNPRRDGYAYYWLDQSTPGVANPGATLATDRAAVRARIATQKAVGTTGSICGIQAHNISEMSVAQLDVMLSEFAADPQVLVLTAREWVHYLRRKYVTRDGGANFVMGRHITTAPIPLGTISPTSLNLIGDQSMMALGNSIYFQGTGGVTNFRLYQSIDDRVILYDVVNNRIHTEFRRGYPAGPPPNVTSAALNAVANAINTTNKFVGRPVWNGTVSRPVYAVGYNPGDVWVYADGTTANTPV